MTTTSAKPELNWENLLTETVTKPGKILAASSPAKSPTLPS